MGRPQNFSDEQIFQGVYHAIQKLGYDQLTLEKIAREVPISPSALSKRFGSKKNLLLSFTHFMISQTKQAFSKVYQQPSPLLPVLEEMLISYTKLDAVSLVNLTTFYLAGIKDSDFYELSQRRMQILTQEIQKIFEKEIENKKLQPFDVVRISRILVSALTGSVFVGIKDPDKDLSSLVHDCFQVILQPYQKLGGSNVNDGDQESVSHHK